MKTREMVEVYEYLGLDSQGRELYNAQPVSLMASEVVFSPFGLSNKQERFQIVSFAGDKIGLVKRMQ